MFRNSGRKIKIMAVIWFVIQIVASAILSLCLFPLCDSLVDDIYLLIPVVVFFCGVIGSWPMSLLIYGFGEIVDSCIEKGE